jgi:hypothetical protein
MRSQYLAERQAAVVRGYAVMPQHGEVVVPQGVTETAQQKRVLENTPGQRHRGQAGVHPSSPGALDGKIHHGTVEPGADARGIDTGPQVRNDRGDDRGRVNLQR